MITSFLEVLELPSFSYMTLSIIQFESRGSFANDVIDKNYDVITFISKYLYFKKA